MMEREKNINGTHNGNFYLEYQQSINYAMVRNGVRTVIAASLENEDATDWHAVKLMLVGEQVSRQELSFDVVEAGRSILLDSLSITAPEEALVNLTEDVETTFTIVISVADEEVFRQNYPLTLRPDDYYLHLDETEHQKEITKQTIWERKLLDFSLRNNMINCKLGKRVIPFVSSFARRERLPHHSLSRHADRACRKRHVSVGPTGWQVTSAGADGD